MEPILELRNVTKHFVLPVSFLGRVLTGHGDRIVHAVNGVSLELYPGETLGLVGESGSGKSTLGRLAIGLLPPTSGQVFFRGEEMIPLRWRKLRRKLQIIFQNPYASLNPRKTVGQILSKALEAGGVKDIQERKVRIKELLKRVGLTERFAAAYPHQLSGGQRQRISILRALAVRPDVVVADEPVSALDVSIQAQILNLLDELRREYNLTYLFVSHDLRVIYNIADRVGVMYAGKLMELGKTEELFVEPMHPYTRALLSAIPRIERGSQERMLLSGNIPSPLNLPKGCLFHSRCPLKIGALCEQEEPRWTWRTVTHGVACHLYR